MAKASVICSECEGKVSFDYPDLKKVDITNASFDCPHCSALMYVEKDYTTTNLAKRMANELALRHSIASKETDWQAVNV